MNVKTHPAERCQNELADCKGSWFSKERFDVILKWMQTYHQEQAAPELEALREEVRLLRREREMLLARSPEDEA
jgi:hypothetical protein